MSDVRPRIRLPRSANAGDVIEVKTLISHNMETGLRRDGSGNEIPRQIINRFTCEYAGKLVLDVTMEPAISANPYMEFDVKVDESADFVFTWYDDDGSVYSETQSFEVS
ncbi:thiosulfate oxidation carrier complex protein SoxZ [Roseinatronobacter bogoriensis]|jgi:sulfur-oxidizing protein SoxZ|uniref:Thiosulfate oxidation carrier complex protein SoxZ n=1 Tax=Roseinatronobacter bogoriensis subsp. barguzinensis TaxID=441209 RepID=A0A2K8KGH6_9RHOB|nr:MULTISPECIES: thiosulfate oxidation carrier complex protein SoxZ [Rhodobaca]ATX65270.1 thiosulfate oxidation carrier complex protein SoxZ [Rhodobaca barguzinensis]MBB4209380.1 sulfur-oxidizing protein SoxZ [Rhodobaca bogoriensis DSM 18756]TDW34559.1 sulfur-oxidizing protein SoxZ [Rhodobaca barguzinensis]TDY67122.1 sulfur-oxidizing protein SoxZ [Rhodobaca bogoriensis DSM 18756]